MKISVCQYQSSEDPWENLHFVAEAVEESVLAGSQVIFFPENIFYRGADLSRLSQKKAELIFSIDQRGWILDNGSEFGKAVAELLNSSPIDMVLGSVCEKSPSGALPFNSQFYVQVGGRIQSYRKIHLFEYRGEQQLVSEKRFFSHGKSSLTVACGEFRIGMSICYDLRFPELYRHEVMNNGANLLSIPANFLFQTGSAHWHTLLAARAIENLSYVVAAAQWGEHKVSSGKSIKSFGNAAVYGPWGQCLWVAPDNGDFVHHMELDLAEVNRCRSILPALDNVRLL